MIGVDLLPCAKGKASGARPVFEIEIHIVRWFRNISSPQRSSSMKNQDRICVVSKTVLASVSSLLFLSSVQVATAFSFVLFSASPSSPAVAATLYMDSFEGTAGTLDRRTPDTVSVGGETWSTDGFSLDGNGAIKGTTAKATLPLYDKIHKGDIIAITAKTSYLGGNGANWLGIGFSPADAKIINIPMMYSWILIWGENSTFPGQVNSFVGGTESKQTGTVTNFNPAALNTVVLELDTGLGILTCSVNGQDVIVRSGIPIDEMHQFDQAVLFNNGGGQPASPKCL